MPAAKALLLPGLAAAMALTGCSALLRGGPAEPAPGDYVNLRAEASYVYSITARHDRFKDQVVTLGTATEEVTRLDGENGETRARVRMVQRFSLPELHLPETEDVTTMVDRGDAVFQLEDDGSETVVLKRPVRVGDAWTSNGGETRVAAFEDVETRYGAFKQAVRLETRFEASTTTTWLDRRVGMVKFSMHDAEGMHLDYELIDIQSPQARRL